MKRIPCPRCDGVSLQLKRAQTSASPGDTIEIDVCPTCRGVWFDADELGQLVDDLYKLGAPELISEVGDLTCPRCPGQLAPASYRGTIVEIDLCSSCGGVWLDPGEFKKIKAGADRLILCCDCWQKYSVSKSRLGSTIECRKCQAVVSVKEGGVGSGLSPLLNDLISTEVDSTASVRLTPRGRYQRPQLSVEHCSEQGPGIRVLRMTWFPLATLKAVGNGFQAVTNLLGASGNWIPCPRCEGTGKMQGLKGPRDCLSCLGEPRVCARCIQVPRFCRCAEHRASESRERRGHWDAGDVFS